jgi:hypothetical protein
VFFFFSGKRGRGGDGNDRGERAESHAVGQADGHGGRGGQHQDQNRRRYQAQVGPPTTLVPVLDTAQSVSSPGTNTRHRGVSSAALVPVLDTAEFHQQPWYQY